MAPAEAFVRDISAAALAALALVRDDLLRQAVDLEGNGQIARAEVIQFEGAGLELRYTRNDKSFVRRMFMDGADLLRAAAVERFELERDGAPVHVPTRPRDRSKHDRAEPPGDRNRCGGSLCRESAG